MGRSLKKGFFVNPSLQDKVNGAQASNSHKPIKTWARGSTVTPKMVGLNLEVHNGKTFTPVHITENMVGHKLGEFSLTRIFKGHQPHTQKK